MQIVVAMQDLEVRKRTRLFDKCPLEDDSMSYPQRGILRG